MLLDEPTNHLNIDSVDVLEKALGDFPGTIILISHDEHLVRAVANRLWMFATTRLRLHDGDYDYFSLSLQSWKQQLRGDVGRTIVPRMELRVQKRLEVLLQKAGQAAGSSRNVKTKEQRRAEAEERNRDRALKMSAWMRSRQR